ncbi:hypothetical protein VNI00_001658 [Paramarasmius palmivorus]|uniref:Protein kinase domain-containing protein n=1 Tax=Paramarasmius palmivorus TaxID=297713 RepID=A0AAW0E4J5_9AGAR
MSASAPQKLTYKFIQSRLIEKIDDDNDFQLPQLPDEIWQKLSNDPLERDRLEFLGDALMSAFVAEHLYKLLSEGTAHYYTQARSALVANATFARIMRHIGYSFGKTKDAADAFECIIGAFHQASGATALQDWQEQYFLPLIYTAAKVCRNIPAKVKRKKNSTFKKWKATPNIISPSLRDRKLRSRYAVPSPQMKTPKRITTAFTVKTPLFIDLTADEEDSSIVDNEIEEIDARDFLGSKGNSKPAPVELLRSQTILRLATSKNRGTEAVPTTPRPISIKTSTRVPVTPNYNLDDEHKPDLGGQTPLGRHRKFRLDKEEHFGPPPEPTEPSPRLPSLEIASQRARARHRPQEHLVTGVLVILLQNASDFSRYEPQLLTTCHLHLTAKFQWIRGELLGKGSYGSVYLALIGTTGELMAVKQVELVAHPDKRQIEISDALRLERNTLKDLDHPNIVRFLGFEESTKNLSILIVYSFMEYVSGGTIGSCLIHHGPFDDEVTKHFLRQMLDGLEYLHSKGIIHRDIKADNILVEKSGDCKISDFGISKQADEDEGRAFTGMKGTVYWMAPEVLVPSTGYDAKIDIWSVGCVAHEMWTGKRPWYGQELFAVMLEVSKNKQSPPLLSNAQLCQRAQHFRKNCFVIDPRRRASAAELRQHRYLVQKPGWRFEPSDIERPANRPSRPKSSSSHSSVERKKASQVTVHQRQRSSPHIPPVPPVPHIPPTLQSSSGKRTLRASSSQPRLDITISPDSLNRPPSPPVVIITPPGSPVRKQTPQYHIDVLSSPSTSDSSTKWSRGRRRSFFVANPDSERPPDAYVYTPPPLPKIRHSTSLSQSNDHNHLAPPGTHTLRSAKSMPFIYPESDSDDDSTFDTLMWKKPPTRSSREERSSRPPSHIDHDRRESALMRPMVDDIHKHLEEWFPDHDVDEPIIYDDDGISQDGERRGIRRGKKSIRVAAEEHRRSLYLQRRGTTKLWESSLEELGHRTRIG